MGAGRVSGVGVSKAIKLIRKRECSCMDITVLSKNSQILYTLYIDGLLDLLNNTTLIKICRKKTWHSTL